MYQIRTVNIKQGSFSRYRFHISDLALCVINWDYLSSGKSYDIIWSRIKFDAFPNLCFLTTSTQIDYTEISNRFNTVL